MKITAEKHRKEMASYRCALKIAVIISAFLSVCSKSAYAEIVANSFICVSGNDGRIVELSYLNRLDTLPCKITESKYDGEERTLWRATFDVSFCKRQFAAYHTKLQTLGVPCGPISAGESVPKKPKDQDQPALAPTPDLLEVVAMQQPSDYKPKQPNNEVFLIESELNGLSIPKQVPTPPNFINSRLTRNEIRQLDDWLIYLSSQSMLSIRNLSPESDVFTNFQISADLDSDDIYTRLQNRIEFLHTLSSM